MSVRTSVEVECRDENDLIRNDMTSHQDLADKILDSKDKPSVIRGYLECYDKYYGKTKVDKLKKEVKRLEDKLASSRGPDGTPKSAKKGMSGMVKIAIAIVVILIIIALIYFVGYPKYLESQEATTERIAPLFAARAAMAFM